MLWSHKTEEISLFTTSLLQDGTTPLLPFVTIKHIQMCGTSLEATIKYNVTVPVDFGLKGLLMYAQESIFSLGCHPFALLLTYSEQKKNTSTEGAHSVLRRCHSCQLFVEVNYVQFSHYVDNNHITTKLVSKTYTSNICCEMYFLLLGQQIICILPL